MEGERDGTPRDRPGSSSRSKAHGSIPTTAEVGGRGKAGRPRGRTTETKRKDVETVGEGPRTVE